MKKIYLLILCLYSTTIFTQNLYFPPVLGTTWDTISPQMSMNWCPAKMDSLKQFLITKNTKSFIVLKNGRIAAEWYFGSFKQDSVWYWASAAKSEYSRHLFKLPRQRLVKRNTRTRRQNQSRSSPFDDNGFGRRRT